MVARKLRKENGEKEEEDINRKQVLLGEIEAFHDRQDVTASQGTLHSVAFFALIGLRWAVSSDVMVTNST